MRDFCKLLMRMEIEATDRRYGPGLETQRRSAERRDRGGIEGLECCFLQARFGMDRGDRNAVHAKFGLLCRRNSPSRTRAAQSGIFFPRLFSKRSNAPRESIMPSGKSPML